MANMHILLTGGHTGLGLGVTKKLLKPGYKVGLIIRSEARQKQILAEFDQLPQELVNNIDFFYADLSDQQQVRAVAQEIKETWPRIDRLFNNAAVLTNGRQTSKHGNEWHYEVNVLSPLILTQELMPLLEASNDAKVITTVTDAMGGRKLSIKHLSDESYSRGMIMYMQSKQAVMLLMNDLADQHPNVSFLSVTPGPNKTKMTQEGGTPAIIRFIAKLFFNEPEVGSQLIYNAGFDPRFADKNKVYIAKDKVVPIKHGMTEGDKKVLLAGIQKVGER